MLVRTIQIDDLLRSNVLLKVYVVYHSCPDDILNNSCLSSFWTSVELRKLQRHPWIMRNTFRTTYISQFSI